MVKLNKILEQLEALKEKIEEKIEDIYCKADEKGGELTGKEVERIDELQQEIDDINGAIDYITDYCD